MIEYLCRKSFTDAGHLTTFRHKKRCTAVRDNNKLIYRLVRDVLAVVPKGSSYRRRSDGKKCLMARYASFADLSAVAVVDSVKIRVYILSCDNKNGSLRCFNHTEFGRLLCLSRIWTGPMVHKYPTSMGSLWSEGLRHELMATEYRQGSAVEVLDILLVQRD